VIEIAGVFKGLEFKDGTATLTFDTAMMSVDRPIFAGERALVRVFGLSDAEGCPHSNVESCGTMGNPKKVLHCLDCGAIFEIEMEGD
jgi:hypothetical protein